MVILLPCLAHEHWQFCSTNFRPSAHALFADHEGSRLLPRQLDVSQRWAEKLGDVTVPKRPKHPKAVRPHVDMRHVFRSWTRLECHKTVRPECLLHSLATHLCAWHGMARLHCTVPFWETSVPGHDQTASAITMKSIPGARHKQPFSLAYGAGSSDLTSPTPTKMKSKTRCYIHHCHPKRPGVQRKGQGLPLVFHLVRGHFDGILLGRCFTDLLRCCNLQTMDFGCEEAKSIDPYTFRFALYIVWPASCCY